MTGGCEVTMLSFNFVQSSRSGWARRNTPVLGYLCTYNRVGLLVGASVQEGCLAARQDPPVVFHQQIANWLLLSPLTVESCLRRVVAKFGVSGAHLARRPLLYRFLRWHARQPVNGC